MIDVGENLFINMDETAVYFDDYHNHTVNEKGAITVQHEALATKITLCAAMEISSLEALHSR